MADYDKYEKEFLDAQKNASTRDTYRAALDLFREFYKAQGTIKDFLRCVENDHKQTSFLNQQRVAINTINQYVEYLKKKTTLKAKTIRTYAGALQALIRYYLPVDVKITTRYAGLPSPSETSEKYKWNPQNVSSFTNLMDQPIYECLVATFFQSGIPVPDVTLLTYGDIEKEYQAGTVPLCLDLRKAKPNKPYLTFIAEAGVTLLANYLPTLQPLVSDTPIFPISVSAVERYFKRRAPRLPEYDNSAMYTPGSLTDSFRLLMHQAGCPTEFINFWTGRKSKLYRTISVKRLREVYSTYSAAVAFSTIQRKWR